MSITKISQSKTAQNQSKFFIGTLNTLVGQSIVELMRNDNENDVNPHIIVGTIDQKEVVQTPKGVKAIIDSSNIGLLTRVALDCDYVIYDITKSSLDEIEFVLKVLKYGDYGTAKTFILISSVLTWGNTQPKERKGEDKSQQDGQIIDQEHKAYSQRYTKIVETDLHLRRCPRRYKQWNELEQKVLYSARPLFRTYVVCAGIVYGNGEETLFPLFRKAWSSQTAEIPIIGEGNNILPMVHSRDLATIVKIIIQLIPNQQYIFAVDASPLNTQKRICTSIADNVGGGLIRNVSLQEGFNIFANDYPGGYDYLTINLWLKPSQILEEQESQLLDANKITQLYCHDGFIKEARRLRDEFQNFRGLQTVKLVLIGPSFVGKSYMAAKLAKKYQIPHITVDGVMGEVNGELGERVQISLKAVREKMQEEALALFEAEKKKKRVVKGQPEPEFDASKLSPRIPDELLAQLYRWRLEQNDAQNLGYVLDGFPKTAEQLRLIFMNPEQVIPIQPKSVVYLEQSDENLKEIIKQQIPQEELISSRYNDEQFSRRILKFRQNIQVVMSLFSELKVECQTIPQKQADDMIISFLERNGPIMVIKDEEKKEEIFVQHLESLLIEEGLQKEESINSNQLNEMLLETDQEQSSNKVSQPRLNQTKVSNKPDKSEIQSVSRIGVGKLNKIDESKKFIDEETKMDMIRQQEREMLDTRSQPLRQYLADNVVPYITEGLIELCKDMPSNPILFLADFLEMKGNEVQLPHAGF